MKKLKSYLFAGLLVWLPLGLTIWVIRFVVHAVDEFIPRELSSQHVLGIAVPGSGLVIAFIILLLTGIIAKNMFGQKIFKFWDRIIFKIPIVKSIYKGIKQVSDTLLASNGNAFRKALLVKFPHQNSYTIAFITGIPNSTVIHDGTHQEYINVYVPTTPNPTSGYFIIVHKNDTKEIDMSVDEALRYVISMGSVNPRRH